MSSHPSPIQALKLRVTQGSNVFEDPISSSSLGPNSLQITSQTFPVIFNAFNNNPPGTIFNPSVVATYATGTFPTGDDLLIPSTQANFLARIISLSNIPNKETTDTSFSLSSLITTVSAGVLSYSSTNTSVATVNSSGQVTPVGVGTTTITVSQAATANHPAGSASATLTVTLPIPRSWVQRGQDIDGEAVGHNSGTSVSLSADGTIVAIGAILNDGSGYFDNGHVRVYVWNGTAWVQRGQDIDGEASDDQSGYSVSLSADGTIVAIGAQFNDGNGSGSGHVRVWAWNGTAWVQRGQDIDGEAAFDFSGTSVSLSADGTIVAIGAYDNDGNNGFGRGHVRVWAWNGTAWVQRGQDIDGEAVSHYDYSGTSVSLSADGTIVAIGAILNDGSGYFNNGHVRVYVWNGTAWVQRGQDIDGEASEDRSGMSVSLSADGTIVAIGAILNDGNGSNSGHVRVYAWNGTAWVQRGLDIDGKAAGDQSGTSVSLSADGTILAIGAQFNDGNGSDSGHVRVWAWNGTAWVQRGQDIDGEASNDRSGRSVSLSADGTIVAIGAILNDGNGYFDNGHVRVFKYQ